MIRHVVMIQWAPGAPADASARLGAALDTLPGLIPEIRRYEHGPDLGLAEGNFDYVVVGDFDSAADWERYRTHPAHLALIADHIRPHLGQRVAVQYDIA